MDDAKQQLVDKLKSANNVLVTVSRNPSVDQLSALLGLTLVLNKQGKHAAAVFSGEVPSTLEFLQPEATIEKNTDSLRDFIIALDKSKADKLRYKVENDVVRIFITPYKTSISEEDFDFSQGDFNVDVVVAIGVQMQEDLDEAITAHGRILHDATVASINTSSDGGLGSISWHQPASSLAELVTELVQTLGPDLLDEQIATALLTGIVAETDRFRNDKTSALTMSASAALMTAGANQQLVASQLEAKAQAEISLAEGESDESHDGTLDIEHQAGEDDTPTTPALELPAPDTDSGPTEDEPAPLEATMPEPPEPPTDDAGTADTPDEPPTDKEKEETAVEAPKEVSAGPKLVTEPPTLGGTLTANSTQERLDPVTDPMSLPQSEPPQLMDHKSEPADLTPPPPAWVPPAAPEPNPVSEAPPPASDTPDQTLTDLETAVKSDSPSPVSAAPSTDLNDARDEVSRALSGAMDPSAPPTEPIQALNSQPFDVDLHPDQAPPSLEQQIPGLSTTLKSDDASDQATQTPDQPISTNDSPQVADPTAPPPVPPPIPFQFGNPPNQQ